MSTPCSETGGLESSPTAEKLVRTHGGDVVGIQEAKPTEKLKTITEQLLEAGTPKASNPGNRKVDPRESEPDTERFWFKDATPA